MKTIVAPILFLTGLLLTAALMQPTLAEASAKVCENPSLHVFADNWGNRASNQSNFHGLTGFYMNTAKITNTSKDCAYKVTLASYKAYEHYTKNVDSQTLFAYKQTVIQPGKTWTQTIPRTDVREMRHRSYN